MEFHSEGGGVKIQEWHKLKCEMTCLSMRLCFNSSKLSPFSIFTSDLDTFSLRLLTSSFTSPHCRNMRLTVLYDKVNTALIIMSDMRQGHSVSAINFVVRMGGVNKIKKIMHL